MPWGVFMGKDRGEWFGVAGSSSGGFTCGRRSGVSWCFQIYRHGAAEASNIISVPIYVLCACVCVCSCSDHRTDSSSLGTFTHRIMRAQCNWRLLTGQLAAAAFRLFVGATRETAPLMILQHIIVVSFAIRTRVTLRAVGVCRPSPPTASRSIFSNYLRSINGPRPTTHPPPKEEAPTSKKV